MFFVVNIRRETRLTGGGFVEDVLWKNFLDVGSPRNPLKIVDLFKIVCSVHM